MPTPAKKILIIEDDESLAQVLEDKLVHEGFEVTRSISAREGLVLIKNQKPNLILLDVMLPGGMHGFDLLEELKRDENLSAIPVFMLTNLDSEEKNAKEIGAAEYIVKANTLMADIIKKIKDYFRR